MTRTKGFVFAAMVTIAVQAPVQAADGFDFSEHRVDRVFQGKLRLPDFEGRDKDFAFFKTRIANEMKEGVTFAGEYSVVQFGCGTGCTSVVVANNRTGQLYDFPRGGESNQGLTLEFNVSSNLMVARWYTDSSWETCVFESLLFEGGKWIAKAAFASTGDDICSVGVLEGVAKVRDF